MAGLLGGFFNFVDPILDTLDPMHNKVQTWTTGSETTKGQSPYFQAIAPIIVDAFLPGVGSAISAADGASTGNWLKTGLGVMGAAGQLGSLGSTAADTANGGLAATEASSGLSSTGGLEAGQVATDAGTAVSATPAVSGAETGSTGLLGAENNFGQVNSFGYQGMNAGSLDSAGNTQFMLTPTSQYSSAAGVGGVGQGLEATSSAAAANSALAAKGIDYGKLAKGVGSTMLEQEQRAAQDRARRQQQTPQVMPMADYGSPSSGRVQSFQNISPYAKFSGGFQSNPYGANVRRTNYGLLG